MDWIAFISWALWWGSIWMLLRYFLDSDFEKRKLLFETRTKVYGQLIGKIQNFLLPDLLEIKSHMRSYEFHSIFSEASLLSSWKLHTMLWVYSKIAGEYYEEIQKRVEATEDQYTVSEELQSKFSEKSKEIIQLMREDLYLIK